MHIIIMKYTLEGGNIMYKKDCCKLPLAEAYVPFQYYDKSYTPMEALKKGTLFPELYRPYEIVDGRTK